MKILYFQHCLVICAISSDCSTNPELRSCKELIAGGPLTCQATSTCLATIPCTEGEYCTSLNICVTAGGSQKKNIHNL